MRQSSPGGARSRFCRSAQIAQHRVNVGPEMLKISPFRFPKPLGIATGFSGFDWGIRLLWAGDLAYRVLFFECGALFRGFRIKV